MKRKKLENIAYKIATGNLTTDTLNKKQWSKIINSKKYEKKIKNIIWQPFKYYSADDMINLVERAADNVVYKFKHLCSDYNE